MNLRRARCWLHHTVLDILDAGTRWRRRIHSIPDRTLNWLHRNLTR